MVAKFHPSDLSSTFKCPDIQLPPSLDSRLFATECEWSSHHLFQDLWIWRLQLYWQPKRGGDKDTPVELRLVASRQSCLPPHLWPEMPPSTSPRKSLVISIIGCAFRLIMSVEMFRKLSFLKCLLLAQIPWNNTTVHENYFYFCCLYYLQETPSKQV